jgi:hypothetical protein
MKKTKQQKKSQKKATQVVVLGQATKLTLGLHGFGTEQLTRHHE